MADTHANEIRAVRRLLEDSAAVVGVALVLHAVAAGHDCRRDRRDRGQRRSSTLDGDPSILPTDDPPA